MSHKLIEDNWKAAGWIQCARCGIYYHPHYSKDERYCDSCFAFLQEHEPQRIENNGKQTHT